MPIASDTRTHKKIKSRWGNWQWSESSSHLLWRRRRECSSLYAFLPQRCYLVLNEGNKRRDDNCNAVGLQRQELVAKRFSTTSRHQNKDIFVRKRCIHCLTLILSKPHVLKYLRCKRVRTNSQLHPAITQRSAFCFACIRFAHLIVIDTQLVTPWIITGPDRSRCFAFLFTDCDRT